MSKPISGVSMLIASKRVTDQLMEPPMIALKAPRRGAVSALQTG